MSSKKGKKLLVLCPYPFDVAPSQRLKFEQYYPAFKEAGYTISISSFISLSFWKIIYKKGNLLLKAWHTIQGYIRRTFDLFRIPFYDVVYIHLWATPFGPPIFERLVRLLSRKIVYDIDDMIYLDDQKSKANPIISSLKGKNKPIYLLKKSDRVLTSTETIEKFAKRLNDNTFNIPISVDTNIYKPKPNYDSQHSKITLGWTGSLSTSPYLHLLDEVFIELRKHADFTLFVMGDENFKIDGVEVKAIPWKAEYEVEVIRSFDIGLYPLPDNKWVYGKGGGKALQYMSLGVPTVATDVGMNYKIIRNNVNGFLVKETADWVGALKKMILDKELRERIGKNGIKTVEENFSVNANKSEYVRLLQE